MIFVDFSVWIDYFNGKDTPETQKLDARLGTFPVCVGDIILTEVLQGFRNDRDFNTARDLLTALTIVNVLDTSIAIKSAEYFRTLRKRGITDGKTVTVIIATFCIEHDLPLLHSDRDFDPFHQYLKLRNALSK
ncbi:PIN domain nuclease [Nitrosomonas sp.]|uniref:type II toxin-antitoxin system VapC family toxin n=1 Tax=Nitrosomonas sp. TaxID=42353 RepID=UPI001E0C3CAB|nr:PIN domain nuclease [Nitrosomonas sp.]MCB1948817.1 PIN domain nuclease [Nitrosomonas sp.]